MQVLIGGEVSPQITPVTGDFLLENLLPGSYDLRLSKAGYMSEDVLGVAVTAGLTTAAGTTVLPEPSQWLLLLSGCVGLACLERRRSVGRRRSPS